VSAPLIPYGRQTIEDDDVEAVVKALRSDFLTTGPEVEAFERELAEACGAKHAIAVANGTAALHCAYAAAQLQPGDEVVTTPLTFSATSNMLLALGARPVFADVDEATLCLDPAAAERAITPRTRAIAAVDFAGNPAPLAELKELALRKGLSFVEDAAHAVGAKLHGRPVGSWADLTTFSFHPVKTITTGEGGAVLCDDAAMATRARDFRNHGMVRDPARLERQDGPWYYEVQSLGFNYRITDLQCALGRSQLRKLARFVERRAQIVAQYRAALAGIDALVLPARTAGAEPAWHLFPVRLRAGEEARRRTFAALREQGILPQVHYVAVNEMPLYRRLGYDAAQTPIALAASRSILSLPLFPSLSDADVSRVVDALVAALGR
jgi:perosamine synthetase